MAKANWLKVDPSQGSGNATVNVSSTSEHTGRKARTTTLTWKAANVANVVRNVSQAILADGWLEHIPPKVEPKKSRMQIVQELVVKQYNERTDISNEEALDYMAIIYPWDYYLDKVLTEGMMVTYEDKPWRVRQTHTPLEIYPPSLATASLYEAIDKEHDGTLEDPIPYNPPMEIFIDKYYIENGIVYHCIRDSGIALTHSLNSLVGLYVEAL